MASKKPMANYSGRLKEMTSGDLIPVANLASGTPDGTKYVRDDGTLATPSGGSGITKTNITGSSATLTVDTMHTVNTATAAVPLLLPSICAVGAIIEIAGSSSGGWKITQNSGQTMHLQDADTTTGTSGFIQSVNRYDCIRLICIIANTDFVAFSGSGNLTVS